MSSGSEPERVWLFRAVSLAELQDIWQIGGFRPGAGSMETKLFTLSRDDAAWFPAADDARDDGAWSDPLPLLRSNKRFRA